MATRMTSIDVVHKCGHTWTIEYAYGIGIQEAKREQKSAATKPCPRCQRPTA